MADVFVSYAHSTSKQAQAAAAALRTAGYSVWLDDDLAVHRAFAQEIEEQLTAAKAALVIWSADAGRSEWVLSEANRAREDRKLVQMAIEKTRLPMPFDQVQCADLSGWTGEGEHPNWRRVTASISELVAGGGGSSPAPLPAPGVQAHASAEPLLAVLAIDNLASDPEMAYFSDGVSEEIQETVARGGDLKVMGRASSFQFRGPDKAAANVAAELGATHVLDGSVRRAGIRVRIAAQLIECANGTSIWTDRFDRELTDIFELQDEIAEAVAAALKRAFATPAQPEPIEPAAFDLYLKAREHRFTPELALGADAGDPQVAVPLLEKSVALAPRFAAAWTALAAARAYQILYGQRREAHAQLRASAVEAARTALRLDPGAGGAYSALALLEPPGRHLDRGRLIDKALAVAPNNPSVRGAMGAHLFIVGRHRESLGFARQAYELDPLFQSGAYALAAQTGIAGDYEESQRLFDSFRAKWPTYLGLTVMALSLAAWNRDWDRFEAVAKQAEAAGLEGPQLYWAVRTGRASRHPDAETAASLSRGLLNQLSRTGTVRLDSLFAASQLGLVQEAFQAIDEASFAHLFEAEGPLPAGGWSPGLLFMPFANRAMIEDTRFVGLCAKLGLCDYWVESGRWPDCAGWVSYDFEAEARRMAGSG